MKCPNPPCGKKLPEFSRFCNTCGHDGGAPNVRAARESSEVAAFQLRYIGEKEKAKDGGYAADLSTFELLASSSSAVMCMPSSRLLPIASGGNSLFSTFALQVEGQARSPQEGSFDSARNAMEEAFFPNYSKYIRFAALSLNGVGQKAYGACSIALKEYAIADRATVFDSPLAVFCETHSVGVAKPIPKGFRADWSSRGQLAAAKIGSKAAGVDDGQAAELILPQAVDTFSDCIEVHVYGPLDRDSISKVTMTAESDPVEALLQEAAILKLREAGIPVEVAA